MCLSGLVLDKHGVVCNSMFGSDIQNLDGGLGSRVVGRARPAIRACRGGLPALMMEAMLRSERVRIGMVVRGWRRSLVVWRVVSSVLRARCVWSGKHLWMSVWSPARMLSVPWGRACAWSPRFWIVVL